MHFPSRIFERDCCRSCAYNLDPDQIPHSATSDLNMHSLLMHVLWIKNVLMTPGNI